MTHRVLGVDACPAGWVGVVLEGSRVCGFVASRFAQLVEAASASGPLAVIGVDIPIGLPDVSRRQADVLARAAIGPRRSSVFMTPVRAALMADTHAEAVAINRERAGEGLSMQAFRLKPKLLDVEAFVAGTTVPVIEVHPELSFTRLAGAFLPTSKKSWAGMLRRRELLSRAGIDLDDLGVAGARSGVDDVLDAAAAAWTARRYLLGQAMSLPDPPETFSDGWPAAIWS